MNNMKKYNIPKCSKAVISGILSLAILCSGVSAAAFSGGFDNKNILKQNANIQQAGEESIASENGKKLLKDETVYVIAEADGTANRIIVSDWIKNTGDKSQIKDVSNLRNIENVKGNESYTIDEKNMYVWNAEGKDIYYQGTGKGELPVQLKISYMLDGKKINADKLAGKSGRVKIRFDYENKQYEKIKINGKEEKIYVPFLMMTGMILDNDKFTDVEISNGKIINNGDRIIAAGFSFPGMMESMGISKDKLEIPDFVEISADVKDFELSATLTLAVNDIFGKADFSKTDDTVKSLTKSLNKLTAASDSLIDGSSELYDGLNTLFDKSGELVGGIGQLYDGAKKINSGAQKLDGGAVELAKGALTLDNGTGTLKSGAFSLDDGIGTLSDGAVNLDDGIEKLSEYVLTLSGGLDKISANSSTLNSGAEQVFNTLLSIADAQIAAAGLTADKLTIKNYASVLDTLIDSLSDENSYKIAYNTALETVTVAVNSQRNVIKTAVEATVRKQITENAISAAGYNITAEQYDEAVAAGQIPDELQLQISSAVSAQMGSSDVQATIESNTEAQVQSLIESNMNSQEILSQIAQGVEKAKTGRESLSSLKKQLNSYCQFYQGVLEYTQGVDRATAGAQQILNGTYTLKGGSASLKDGAGRLKDGAVILKNGTTQLKKGSSSLKQGADKLKSSTNELSRGTKTLFNGAETLKDGSCVLLDGVNQLKEGSMTLCDGLKKFKKEGVNVLVNAVEGDVKGLINRLKAISKVDGRYKSYSGISKDMDGKVDFIFKTHSVEK